MYACAESRLGRRSARRKPRPGASLQSAPKLDVRVQKDEPNRTFWRVKGVLPDGSHAEESPTENLPSDTDKRARSRSRPALSQNGLGHSADSGSPTRQSSRSRSRPGEKEYEKVDKRLHNTTRPGPSTRMTTWTLHENGRTRTPGTGDGAVAGLPHRERVRPVARPLQTRPGVKYRVFYGLHHCTCEDCGATAADASTSGPPTTG